MKPKRPASPSARKTVSLDPVVWGWATKLMAAKGHNKNFSAYVAELIRRDQEREEEKEQRKRTDPDDEGDDPNPKKKAA